MSIRSVSIGAGLILGALAIYIPRPLPVAPVQFAASVSQPAPPPVGATLLVPLESVRVSIARQTVPKAKTADPKQILVAQNPSHVHRVSRDTLCFNAGASRECQATFAAALLSTAFPREGEAAADAQQPLRFHKRAAWVRRLETIGKEGVPFMRVPRGPENELVVGIDRKGMLGFSLRQVSDRER